MALKRTLKIHILLSFLICSIPILNNECHDLTTENVKTAIDNFNNGAPSVTTSFVEQSQLGYLVEIPQNYLPNGLYSQISLANAPASPTLDNGITLVASDCGLNADGTRTCYFDEYLIQDCDDAVPAILDKRQFAIKMTFTPSSIDKLSSLNDIFSSSIVGLEYGCGIDDFDVCFFAETIIINPVARYINKSNPGQMLRYGDDLRVEIDVDLDNTDNQIGDDFTYSAALRSLTFSLLRDGATVDNISLRLSGTSNGQFYEYGVYSRLNSPGLYWNYQLKVLSFSAPILLTGGIYDFSSDQEYLMQETTMSISFTLSVVLDSFGTNCSISGDKSLPCNPCRVLTGSPFLKCLAVLQPFYYIENQSYDTCATLDNPYSTCFIDEPDLKTTPCSNDIEYCVQPPATIYPNHLCFGDGPLSVVACAKLIVPPEYNSQQCANGITVCEELVKEYMIPIPDHPCIASNDLINCIADEGFPKSSRNLFSSSKQSKKQRIANNYEIQIKNIHKESIQEAITALAQNKTRIIKNDEETSLGILIIIIALPLVLIIGLIILLFWLYLSNNRTSNQTKNDIATFQSPQSKLSVASKYSFNQVQAQREFSMTLEKSRIVEKEAKIG